MKSFYVFQKKHDLLLLKQKLLLVMKLTTMILLIVCVGVSAKGFSQTITYSGKNVPLKKIFSVIEQQTGHVFFYNDAALSDSHPVTVRLKHAKLPKALKEIFKAQGLHYNIEGKTIFLQRDHKQATHSLDSTDIGKLIKIHGTVTDSATGEP